MQHIVIIGNGIAGVTAAIELRKLSSNRITIISNETEYFFSRTALMYVFMGQMKWNHIEPYERNFWEKNGIDLVLGQAQKIDFQDQLIQLKEGQSISYSKLVIACGSKFSVPKLEGIELEGVKGLYSKQDFDYIWNWVKGSSYRKPKIKRACILGGGLIGVELAEMLHNEGVEVDFIVRDASFWRSNLPKEESAMITEHLMSKGIRLFLKNEILKIEGKDNAIRMIHLKNGESIETDFLGLTIGVEPNVDWLRSSEVALNRGILVNEKLQTNQPNVYAIGDCAEIQKPQHGRKSIEAVWYTGRKMGEVVAQNIAGIETSYSPGYWFNSAKFFDLEYQVYGNVNTAIENSADSIVYRKPNGMLRFVFENNELKGVLGIGIRASQSMAENWLNQMVNMDFIKSNFKSILFEEEWSTLPIIEKDNE